MDHSAHVIGMGEVGRRLTAALERAGWRVRCVTRRAGWPRAVDVSEPGPRILAVREEALAEVLDRFPAALRSKLVLVQNGFLEAVHGSLEPATRGLIWFTSKGEFFRVLGPSPFYGEHARPLAAALSAGNIPCEALAARATFLEAMVVKGVWNAVVGLPLAVHDVDLATYLQDYGDELRALVEESVRAAGAEYGLQVAPGSAIRTIRDTTTELGWLRGGAKALAWRNGALALFGRRHGVPTPVNDRLLAAVGYETS